MRLLLGGRNCPHVACLMLVLARVFLSCQALRHREPHWLAGGEFVGAH